eukprot:gene12341-13494_t
MVDSARSYIQEYLSLTVEPSLRNFDPEKSYYFYLGNEAADADSIISSLTWASISQHVRNPSSNSVHIPLISVPREEYQLRPETKLLLDQQAINILSIPSLYDIPSNPSLHQSLLDNTSKINFVLLDHNLLSEKFHTVFPNNHPINIIQILDHHQDYGNYLEQCQGDKRVIAFDAESKAALVASTCTIIEEKLQDVLRSENALLQEKLLQEVQHLLLGVILIDSLNMSPKAGKGTPRDEKAIEHLLTQRSYTQEQREELFQLLISAKNSKTFWNEISFINCLRFDYKLFLNDLKTKRVGYSSVLLPINEFLNKLQSPLPHQPIEQLEYFYSSQGENLDLLVILSFYEGRREILILSKNYEQLQRLKESLLGQPELRLEEFQLTDEVHQIFQDNKYLSFAFHQGNVVFSRKQIAPIISSLFQ